MNKIHYLKSAIICLLISVSFSFWSCNEAQNEMPPPSCDHNHAVPVTITAETAVKIGINALNRLKYGDEALQSRANELTAKEVRKYPESSRSTQRQCYIVNFEEGGFAVVAPNGEVLAMNEAGAFSPEEYEPDNFFMDLALNYVNNPALLSGDPEPFPVDTLSPPEHAFIWHNGHRCALYSNTETTIERFKLLKTKWHQGYPYNIMCPNNSVVGCLPLALAQIMAYHKKPDSYQGHTYHWEYMDQEQYTDENSLGIDDVAHLCWQIGVETQTEYGLTISLTTSTYILHTLSLFGYNSAQMIYNYSESIVLNEILNNRPIAIGATERNLSVGHFWVIDGAYRTLTSVRHMNLDTNQLCYETSNYYTYVHCNWGWGDIVDRNDGYYKSGVFNPKNKNEEGYNSNFRIVYNIK